LYFLKTWAFHNADDCGVCTGLLSRQF